MSAFGRRTYATLALVLTLAGGVSIGVATAFRATGGEPPLGAVRSGPWRAWPRAVGPDADPYARAVVARDGRIPLATGAGLRFFAKVDSDGGRLVGRCDYRITGPMPPAQAWTLALVDTDGLVPPGRTVRSGFTSAELIRTIDGGFTITVAAQARPGNWLPSERVDRFMLMLSLYDTPLGTALRMGGAVPALPGIVMEPCT